MLCNYFNFYSESNTKMEYTNIESGFLEIDDGKIIQDKKRVITINEKNIEEFLGLPRFRKSYGEESPQVGVTTSKATPSTGITSTPAPPSLPMISLVIANLNPRNLV